MSPNTINTDQLILRYLEDIEQERINFGLYETYVTKADIIQCAQEKGENLDEAALEEGLASLEEQRWVLKLDENHYRSRISEIVRLLKNVKQRFCPNDAQSAPYLIQSIRVEFADRRRLARKTQFKEIIQQLFKNSITLILKHLDKARKAVQNGFCKALNKELDEVRLTSVQERALQQITQKYFQRKGHGYVITGNTGSGKTEAALLPLLLGALQEKMNNIAGCKIILVYPRQTLAKNQLERLSQYVASINQQVYGMAMSGVSKQDLTVGIVFGDTPSNDEELRNGYWKDGKLQRGRWEKQDEKYKLPYFTDKNGEPIYAVNLANGECTLKPADSSWELEGFKATRSAIQSNPPDVLIITTEMLHRWLMDAAFNDFFGLPTRPGCPPNFCAPRAVVFDEIHLYDTIHGAQIGLLIRRLRHRLQQAMRSYDGESWQYPLMLGMSATIGNPQKFWQELSGVPYVDEISPDKEKDMEDAQGREYFLFIRPETYSRGKPVGDASTAIQTIMAIAHNMRRRDSDGKEPPKFRSLVFQDSISKVKKLALEFHDAETNKNLARYRLQRPNFSQDVLTSPEFLDGEYWYFDAEDLDQYSTQRQPGTEARSLTSMPFPVYSGSGKGDIEILQQDIIFATTSLEVGYDDASIQFVMQHHAPRNPASFVQKKGRAGRSLQDRPITAVTLSQNSFKDAFYYQNPQLLYDPSDYRPPLNVDNYFVQQFQTIALIFDELARLRQRRDLLQGNFSSVEEHLDEIQQELDKSEIGQTLQYAYNYVTGEPFQKVHPNWREIWDWFKTRMLEDDIRYNFGKNNNLLQICPDLPNNLFSSINLPTVRVMFRGGGDSENWLGAADEDISLAFLELSPGKITRRYNPRYHLYWRPLLAQVKPSPTKAGYPVPNAVAIERYKYEKRSENPGPFNSLLLKQLDKVWGSNWQDYLPLNVEQVYTQAVPQRFYRVRYLELWDFGKDLVNDPKHPNTEWLGAFKPDGSVDLRFGSKREQLDKLYPDKVRSVSPDSNSYPLSFSVVKVNTAEQEEVEPRHRLELPPLFKGLVNNLDFYYGEVGENRSMLNVWEVQYGAEARIRLLPDEQLLRQGRKDPHAGMGQNTVRYISEHDGKPTLYGYDLRTEGVRVPYSYEQLRTVAESLFEEIWNDPKRKTHLQDQYLRFLLKSSSWQPKGVEHPLTAFDLRKVADIIATMRAESRAMGTEDWRTFLDHLTNFDELNNLVDMVRATYWRDHRVFPDDFRDRLVSTLTYSNSVTESQSDSAIQGTLFDTTAFQTETTTSKEPATPSNTRQLLEEQVFAKLGKKSEILDYLMDNIVHSLKQATRNLFLTEGSTRDEEIGSHSVLNLTYGKKPWDTSFYVYERNQDGNGATRLASEVLKENPTHLLKRWWEVTLSCPVGDEEDFLKRVLRDNKQLLLDFQETFFQSEPQDRPNPRDFLFPLVEGQVKDKNHDPLLQRLAGLLTSELSIAGQTLRRIGLQSELLHLEDALAERFKRPPTPRELAGYAATQVQHEPTNYPYLAQLMQRYEEHTQNLGLEDEDSEDTANALDRFLAQVENMSLSTCVDACPACLAASCDHGHIDVMRHTISRRYLKMARHLLTQELTREYGQEPVENLVAIAQQNGGYVILEHQSEPDDAYKLQLKNQGFERIKRDFDHETFIGQQVFYYQGNT